MLKLLKMSEGSDALKADKPKAVKKFKGVQTVKKFSRYFVLYCFSPLLCFSVCWICLNLKAVLLALRVVCLVKIPEVWHFCSNQWFFFMLINVIVISLALMSGSLAPFNGSDDFYDEFVRKNEAARKYYGYRPVLENKLANSEATFSGRRNSVERTARPRSRKLRSSESMEMRRTQSLEATATAGSLIVIEVLSSESTSMTDEELQRRSDEFIANFNKRIGEESLALRSGK